MRTSLDLSPEHVLAKPYGNLFGAGAALADPTELRHIAIDQLKLRPLHTRAEIDSVRSLRSHIDLDIHTKVDPLFVAHEKKETSWV